MTPIFNEHGQPLRCILCRGMFRKLPTIWGERGPVCQTCNSIQLDLRLRPGSVYLVKETFGDRRYEILE